ncbi:hypothetical protein RE428_10950 [Marinobacter nanhaiticus D15-8W]|uniref:Lipoprotein n=1 Tax=Marinobacter nanhaiticus D15-8W TaxID=626887 RepID=N6WNY3_9GAMM|nr:hypothetical protein [Marinobacter nanhaiticus]ENO12732.1 hypothetical protein J057_15070 [Marinobacter nanhaiticus D15-8W]BES70077.1 hypothetical protein RE428_10950 [Marinobacter nanhaiticus D15-8W]
MKNKVLVLNIALLALSGCTNTGHNSEGLPLDASATYCQEIRVSQPEHYSEICESAAAWKARDPQGYAQSSRDDGYDLWDFIFDLAGEDDDRHRPAYSTRGPFEGSCWDPTHPACQAALRRSQR